MKKHKCIDMVTKAAYRQLKRKADFFACALTGDCGFEHPEVNRIALESMLVGWLRSTASWRRYEKHCRQFHKNEDLYVMAYDQAAQAAYDVLLDDGELLAYFYTCEELNQMIGETPVSRKSAMAAKLGKAKEPSGVCTEDGVQESPARKAVREFLSELSQPMKPQKVFRTKTRLQTKIEQAKENLGIAI